MPYLVWFGRILDILTSNQLEAISCSFSASQFTTDHVHSNDLCCACPGARLHLCSCNKAKIEYLGRQNFGLGSATTCHLLGLYLGVVFLERKQYAAQ